MRFTHKHRLVLSGLIWAEGTHELTLGPSSFGMAKGLVVQALCSVERSPVRNPNSQGLNVDPNGKLQPDAKQTKAKQAGELYTISVSPSLHLLVSPGKPLWLLC